MQFVWQIGLCFYCAEQFLQNTSFRFLFSHLLFHPKLSLSLSLSSPTGSPLPPFLLCVAAVWWDP
jgi:hypothetical protein